MDMYNERLRPTSTKDYNIIDRLYILFFWPDAQVLLGPYSIVFAHAFEIYKRFQ